MGEGGGVRVKEEAFLAQATVVRALFHLNCFAEKSITPLSQGKKGGKWKVFKNTGNLDILSLSHHEVFS